MAKTTTKTAKTKVKVAQLQQKLSGFDLLGEIVTWNPKSSGNKVHQYGDVVKALTDCQLNAEVAGEFLPRNAFTRACKDLDDDRIIDLFKEEGSNLVFQFTAKTLSDLGWEYDKKVFVKLNRETGKIQCDVPQLEELAQKKLDEAMVTRTTTDITKIIQKLMEGESDLSPIRDQGGVYFIPAECCPFTDKIELFLKALGGSMRRIPVPAGTQTGDNAVRDIMADKLDRLITEHKVAVKGFSINTQKGTIEAAAEKIKTTRTKIEAYANYLKDRSADLLKEVEAANQQLVEQIAAIAGQKATAPPVDKEARLVFGHAMTAIVRWMAAKGWSIEAIREGFAELKVEIGEGTIKTQTGRAKRGVEIPELGEDQVKKLELLKKKIDKNLAKETKP